MPSIAQHPEPQTLNRKPHASVRCTLGDSGTGPRAWDLGGATGEPHAGACQGAGGAAAVPWFADWLVRAMSIGLRGYKP